MTTSAWPATGRCRPARPAARRNGRYPRQFRDHVPSVARRGAARAVPIHRPRRGARTRRRSGRCAAQTARRGGSDRISRHASTKRRLPGGVAVVKASLSSSASASVSVSMRQSVRTEGASLALNCFGSATVGDGGDLYHPASARAQAEHRQDRRNPGERWDRPGRSAQRAGEAAFLQRRLPRFGTNETWTLTMISMYCLGGTRQGGCWRLVEWNVS